MSSPSRRVTPLSPLASMILVVTAAQAGLAAGPVTHWLWTGRWEWMAWFFNYPSPLFFVFMNGLTFVLSLAALRQFLPGQSLRMAWFLISIASGCRLLGSVFTQLTNCARMVHWLAKIEAAWSDPVIPALWHEAGWAIEGPLSMVMLAGGLFIVLMLYKRLGLLAKLTALDHALLGVVAAYSVYVARAIFQVQFRYHAPVTLNSVFHWTGDPLLCLLLCEAILIHRAIAEMGWGLVARCWGAFVVAIFFTSVGSMGQWAVNFGYISWSHAAFTWYLWYPVSAAFALAPAYQLQATYTAKTRVKDHARRAGERVSHAGVDRASA
jgi:hypothetical protein